MGEINDVAVLGCGLMGSALVCAFADGGHRVAAWNRTPERAKRLAGDRVTPYDRIEDAVRSARLVVACLSSYETTTAALGPVPGWNGTTLVNLASGAPDEVTALDGWARRRGAEYLDGSIVGYPQDMGTAKGAILYSGSPTAWREHERTLMALGGSSAHVSDQVTAASVLNVGLVGGFYVAALGAYVEAATYVLGQGVAPGVLDLLGQVTIEGLRTATQDVANAIGGDEHRTEQATIDTYLEAAGAALAVMHGSGHRARLLAAAVENLRTASAAGFGPLGFSAQTHIAEA